MRRQFFPVWAVKRFHANPTNWANYVTRSVSRESKFFLDHWSTDSHTKIAAALYAPRWKASLNYKFPYFGHLLIFVPFKCRTQWKRAESYLVWFFLSFCSTEIRLSNSTGGEVWRSIFVVVLCSSRRVMWSGHGRVYIQSGYRNSQKTRASFSLLQRWRH